MPSRSTTTLILAFWVAVTGYVGYRDVWPRYFSAGPPPVFIDLADEAAQSVPVRWTVSRNGQPVGRLTTQMKYVEADDTFRFVHDYRHLRFEIGNLAIVVPELTNVVRVTRAGDLREQSTDGKLELHARGGKVGDATVKVAGTVAGGWLTATAEITSPLGNMSKALDPVPVPRGQPLNPLQPVNRIAGLTPGRRWEVHEFDPLRDAIAALVREKAAEFGFKLPEEQKESLVAAVSSEPRNLDRRDGPVPCWVIEYRRAELAARTWVRVSDGKVLKQEAFHKGEHLAIDRDE